MSLQELITAARGGGDAPTLADRERVRAKLAARTTGAALIEDATSEPARSGVRPAFVAPLAAPPARRRTPRWLVRSLLAAALLAVGSASALEAHRVLVKRTQAPAAAPASFRVPSTGALPAPVPVSPPLDEARSPQAPPPASGAAAPRGRADRSRSAGIAAAGPGLADELDLVQQARAALHRGAPGEALALLDRRDERHPAGTLGQEAAALRILALCDVGRLDEARVRGGAFARSWPHSPLAARIQGSCATEPGAGK